jgi:hypothetical protein
MTLIPELAPGVRELILVAGFEVAPFSSTWLVGKPGLKKYHIPSKWTTMEEWQSALTAITETYERGG